MRESDRKRIGKQVRGSMATYYREWRGEVVKVCEVSTVAKMIDEAGGVPANMTATKSHEIHLLAGDYLEVLEWIKTHKGKFV